MVVGHEQRRLQRLQQGLFPDVAVAVVDKGAWLHIAVGVDVQIPPAARDAAVGVFTVVPEVQGKDGLLLPHFTHKMIHVRALLRGYHQLGHGVPVCRFDNVQVGE